MQNCELVDVLTQPDWVIAIARVATWQQPADFLSPERSPDYAYCESLEDESLEDESLEKDDEASTPRVYGYRCWVFTPDFTVLDDGEVHPSREAAAESARRLVLDSREF